MEWWVLLVKIALDLVVNQIEIQKTNAQAAEDPEALAVVQAHQPLVGAIAKDVSELESRLNAARPPHSGLGQDIAATVDHVAQDIEVLTLRAHAKKLAALLEPTGLDHSAQGADERSLEDYEAIFKTIECPPIAYDFQDDLEFARLRVDGPNPMLIEVVSAVPAGCQITSDDYAAVVSGDTLAAALADGRLFQCDYKDLSAIAEIGTTNGVQKYLARPVALFAVPPQSEVLVPVAIRCEPDNPACPVVTPTNSTAGQWGWQMAKFFVQVADGNYHELFAHLARTHLVIEGVAVAAHRHLANQHPIWALLVPHFEGTMFINDAAANSLIVANGPIDHIFAGTIESNQQAAATARLDFDFALKMLPTDLEARGVGVTSALADYPYRDDGLLVWQAIHD
ncbi:hypothetical protein FEV51_02510 [Qipengyuania marisflavi]|uniref:Lipoxygenase domain-containing protein n=1 Tax=Qipengyuania marisflavi TaxID=2486356 RepID=A0A5S3PBE9_9SPHN|nr:hypothetical protein FEV51_02510 [Qipengyuania marisflavi]